MKRLKKLAVFILFLILIFSSACFYASAEEPETAAPDTYIEASGAKEAFSSLPKTYREMLEDIGLDDISYEAVINIGAKDAFFLITDIFRQKLESPVKAVIITIGITIMFAVFSSYGNPINKKSKSAADLCECLAVCGILCVPISQCVSHACSIIKISADFMLALIPVLVGIMAAGGSPLTAAGWNTMAFSAAQFFSCCAKSVVSPVIRILLSVNLISAVTPEFKISAVGDFIKKLITAAMGLAATLFSGILTVKSVLASSADSAMMKGAKFLSGSFIPIVGGALGDAAASVAGAVSMAKNTIGAVGIIAITVLYIPGIAEALIWLFLMGILSASAEILERPMVSQAAKAVSSAVSLLNVTMLLNAAVMIISIGILISLRSAL